MRLRSCFVAGLLMAAALPGLDASQIGDEIYNQGMAHYSNRNFRDAEFYLGQVLHDNPQHHTARYYLAATMGAMGKASQARPHVEYLLKIDPQNASYQALMDQLNKVAALQSNGGSGHQNEVRQPVQGDAYIPGVRKLTETGGGMVPLISDGAPQTPAPKLPGGYEKLQEAVASNDPQVRRDAIRELIDKKDTRLVPLLAWALHDNPCRELAGRALLNLGDSGIEKLIEYAKVEKETSNKKFVFGMLGRSGNSRADKFIFETFNQGEPAFMPVIEEVLADKGKEILPEMISALSSKSKNVRYSAATIITRIGEDAVSPLIDVLFKQTGSIREEAAAILGGMSREKVFQTFTREQLEKLKNDDSAEIAAFAESLLPPPPAVGAGVPEIIP